MCATCGCSVSPGPPAHDHAHGHGHTVTLEQKVLARNDELAARNRSWLTQRGIRAVNMMSSPGSGKTTLLERTIRDLAGETDMAVVEGDQETSFDADRIDATGCSVVQVNTGAGCHLDAEMLAGALRALDPRPRSVVFIENVGNLVCPALFDLGETSRAVVMSVTEGADKPLKYPYMFRIADIVVLNKMDLLPYLDFPVDRFRHYLDRVRPGATVLEVSATKGDGMSGWYSWLLDAVDGER
ncbi:MAG TPA: hydrogenase nickel incorporation protein HypB [Actinophytocola sp.]|uniref:hydrogenase nickel incorporation protein HypB n=1 Tax=Actinophytocola sp. TaxID=1872138 RepID=UPI002DB7131D|nr:hydrogenase nickel incorporation protein HypB [Actinophytocola sp.]HEU5474972.1 hydrogenase nickel incorporation protein HypB [Actinophytocola sp.]